MLEVSVCYAAFLYSCIQEMGTELSEKFVRGADGHLFLANDSNNIYSQITGKWKFGENLFSSIHETHKIRKEKSEQLNCDYFHIIVPNKETSLRDFLPVEYEYECEGPTPTNFYLKNFEDVASWTFFDPDILKPAQTPTNEYHNRLNSHWNYRGATRYLKQAFNAFGLPESNILEDLSFSEKRILDRADLGLHANESGEDVEVLNVVAPQSSKLFAGNIVNEGYVRHQTSSRGRRRAYFAHDSFMVYAFDVIGEVFSESLCVHSPDLDWDYLSLFKPDVIIFLQAERFLPRLPSNSLNLPDKVDELSARKGVAPITGAYLRGLTARPD